MDLIGEIVKYEKRAEKIVEDAKKESEKIISDSQAQAVENRRQMENDRVSSSEDAQRQCDELEQTRCKEIDTQLEQSIAKLDNVMEQNRSAWADEIFSNITKID